MYIAVENVWVLEIAIFLGIFMGIGASWLDSFIRRPSATLLSAHQRRVDVQRQLAEVKSVQLEFVKHSMLSRELIKADKAVEAAASGDALQLASRLSLVNKAKIVVAGALFAIFYGRPAISTNTSLFWPLSGLLLSHAPTSAPMFVHGAAAEPVQMYLVPAFLVTLAAYASTGLLARLVLRLAGRK